MGRAAAMAERLPPLYREGDLTTGLLDVVAVQNEVLDEETFEVQRAHWFDTCLDLDEAAALAAVLDIGPEPWHSLGEYRAWVHALRDARLREGSVTLGAIRLFVERYSRGFEAANDVAVVRSPTPSIVENPRHVVRHRPGSTEPLQRFTVTNRGLDPAPLAALLVGFGSTGPEYAPMLANLATGAAVVYRGEVPPGQRLVLRPGDGSPVATLEGIDVSDRLRVDGGDPLTLARGDNEMWFLPVAHHDTPGLDRFLLHLAGDDLRQGRWEETAFDESLFYQDPAATIGLAWVETMPAAFRAELSAATMASLPDGLDDALAARDELALAVDTALAELSAAGVRSAVALSAHHDVQPAHDRLRMILPMTRRELGSVGADQLPDEGGLFDVTSFDDSTMR